MPITIYETKFLLSWGLTIIIESGILFLLRLFFYFKDLRKTDSIRLFFVSFIASSLTLPYVWFILPIFISSKVFYILISELLAIFIEAVIYWQFLKIKIKKGIILSFIGNLSSFLIGIFIQLF